MADKENTFDVNVKLSHGPGNFTEGGSPKVMVGDKGHWIDHTGNLHGKSTVEGFNPSVFTPLAEKKEVFGKDFAASSRYQLAGIAGQVRALSVRDGAAAIFYSPSGKGGTITPIPSVSSSPGVPHSINPVNTGPVFRTDTASVKNTINAGNINQGQVVTPSVKEGVSLFASRGSNVIPSSGPLQLPPNIPHVLHALAKKDPGIVRKWVDQQRNDWSSGYQAAFSGARGGEGGILPNYKTDTSISGFLKRRQQELGESYIPNKYAQDLMETRKDRGYTGGGSRREIVDAFFDKDSRSMLGLDQESSNRNSPRGREYNKWATASLAEGMIEAQGRGLDNRKLPVRQTYIVGEVDKLAKIPVAKDSAIGLLARLSGVGAGGNVGSVSGGGPGSPGGILGGLRGLLGGGGAAAGGGSGGLLGGGFLGQIGEQFRHAAIWQAYTPLIAGAGMMAAKAFGQGDFISKPQFGLIGVGFNEGMRRQSAEWALGLQHPYTHPQRHLETLKEVASALNVETTPGSLQRIQRSAELTSMAAQYAMTDEGNVARYTGRMKNLITKDPRYKHLSAEEAYNQVLSSQAKIMQLGTAHLPEFYTASTYALQPMMQRGSTFEEASAELSWHVEQIGGKAGPAAQKLAMGQSVLGKMAKASIIRDVFDKNVGAYGLDPKAVYKTIKDTPDKFFTKGPGRNLLSQRIRQLDRQMKTERGRIVTMANYKKDLDALIHNGLLKGSRGNIIDESLIPYVSLYGNVETSEDVDKILKEWKEKQGTVDLPGDLRQLYTDQSFGSIAGRTGKGMEVHYDSLRNDIGRPAYRWVNKQMQSGSVAPMYLHSVKSGNADEQAKYIAIMRDLASRGEGREITPEMLKGARMYDKEGSKVKSMWEEGAGAVVPTGDMISNYKKYGKSPEAWGLTGYGTAATATGSILGVGALLGLLGITAPISIPAALLAVGGGALLTGGTSYGAQAAWEMFKTNAPTLESFQKRADYDAKAWERDTNKWETKEDIVRGPQRFGKDRFHPVSEEWGKVIGEAGETPWSSSTMPPINAGPSENDVKQYSDKVEKGQLSPTVIVPAPVVNVYVSSAGGVTKVSSDSSPTNTPVGGNGGYNPYAPISLETYRSPVLGNQ
jgi:hypothetical protein